jgi:hypothetical protein
MTQNKPPIIFKKNNTPSVLLIHCPHEAGFQTIYHLIRQKICDSNDLNCDCQQCHLLSIHQHPDVCEMDGNDKLTHGIQSVRTFISHFQKTPSRSDSTIGVIYAVDKLTDAAMNALLKTMEELKLHQFIWLVTDNPSRLPKTLLSRCQKVQVGFDEKEKTLYHTDNVCLSFPDKLSSDAFREHISRDFLRALTTPCEWSGFIHICQKLSVIDFSKWMILFLTDAISFKIDARGNKPQWLEWTDNYAIVELNEMLIFWEKLLRQVHQYLGINLNYQLQAFLIMFYKG